jgi:hypothetical protein
VESGAAGIYKVPSAIRQYFFKRPFRQEPALVMRDVVTNVFGRLGMVGVILLVSALIFGALAGGVIIHRLDTTPTASNESRQAEKDVEQGDKQSKQSKPPKSNHATQGHPASPEPDDIQDKDA